MFFMWLKKKLGRLFFIPTTQCILERYIVSNVCVDIFLCITFSKALSCWYDNQHRKSVNNIWYGLISEQWVTPWSVCVVLIQEYNVLCSLSGNEGLLKTVEAAEALGHALAVMTHFHELE